LAWKSTCTPARRASKQLRDDLPGSRSVTSLYVAVLGAAAGAGFCNEIAGCSVCKAARTDKPQLQNTQRPLLLLSADLGIDRKAF
jgi:hypothetical protein